MKNKILMYEELSQNAHPALQTQLYDGWILRYSKGHQEKRINSINPLYPSTLDLYSKINECEKRYSAQDLPTIFKITESTTPDIDVVLEKLGYDKVSPTYVMEMPLQDKEFAFGDCILSENADDKWLYAYETFSKRTGNPEIVSSARIFGNIKNIAIYGRIVKNGIDVACGSMVIECGYMGLLNILVDEQFRGRKYGMEICVSLLSEAKRLGVHTAYLQVEQNNQIALNLYTKLGYKTIYSYWYRIKHI